MSYNTLAVQVRDQALRSRINSSIQQEARTSAREGDPTSVTIIGGGQQVLDQFVWDVATATEAEYASALAGGNPDPGGDEAVISDAMILSAVQASWPTPPVVT